MERNDVFIVWLEDYPPRELKEGYEKDIRQAMEYALDHGITALEIKARRELLQAGCITRVIIRDVFRRGQRT